MAPRDAAKSLLSTLVSEASGESQIRAIENVFDRWRITEEDLDALRAAAATLEHPGLAAPLGNIAGKPIELVGRALPEAASKAVAVATTKALDKALAVALRTMEKEPKAASRLLHKALAAASGAVGGGFGLAALPIELPISTGRYRTRFCNAFLVHLPIRAEAILDVRQLEPSEAPEPEITLDVIRRCP
jgi:hypothetical protein